MSNTVSCQNISSKELRMPTEDKLAHIFLDMAIKKSKKWDISDLNDLIIQTQYEYELLKKYRDLKNKNSIQQNNNLIKKINNSDYKVLQHSESTKQLYIDEYDE